MKDIKNLTVADLRAMAKKNGIKQVKRDGSFKKKADLIRDLKKKGKL